MDAWSAPRRAAAPTAGPTELEDKYLRLKDEHLALKRYAHEQDEKIKKMATKLVRLTADLKRYQGGTHEGDVSISFSSKKGRTDPEAEAIIDELREQNAALRKTNDDQARKLVHFRNLSAGAGRRRGPYEAVEPRTDTGLDRRRLVPGMTISGGPGASGKLHGGDSINASRFSTLHGEDGGDGSDDGRDPSTEAEMQRLIDFLRSKLVEAQQALEALEAENAELRAGGGARTSVPTQQEYELRILRLQTELQALQAQLGAQSASMEQSRTVLDPLRANSDRLLEENRALSAELRAERAKAAKADGYLNKIQLLEAALAEAQTMLRDEREAKAAALAESRRLLSEPLFGDLAKANSKQFDALRAQMDEQSADAADARAKAAAAQSRLEAQNGELTAARAEARRLQAKLAEALAALDEARRQLAFFETAGVDMSDLQRALAMVKAQGEGRGADTELSFLLAESGWAGGDAAQASLVHDLRKAQQMLELQTRMVAELKAAAADNERQVAMMQSSYEAELRAFAAQVDAKNERIRTLEEQLAGFLYHVPGKWMQPRGDADAVALGPNQNLFEVTLDRAELAGEALDHDGPYFCAFDVFDFETMATPVRASLAPVWAYTARYIVESEPALFDWLQASVLVVELYQAAGMVCRQVGTAFLSLDEIARDLSGKAITGTAAIAGTAISGAVGRLHYSLRMARPMTEALALHRKREQVIETLDPTKLVVAAAARADQQRAALLPRNTLTVAVRSIVGAPSGRRLCVFYQLGTQPRTQTAVVRADDEAGGAYTFAHTAEFPVAQTAELHSLLSTAELDLVVVDMEDPNPAAFFAIAAVPLRALVAAGGGRIAASLPLLSPSSASLGALAVELFWAEPYRAPSSSPPPAVPAGRVSATPRAAGQPMSPPRAPVPHVHFEGNKENRTDMRQTVTVMISDLLLRHRGVVHGIAGKVTLMYAFLDEWIEVPMVNMAPLAGATEADHATVVSFAHKRTFELPFGSKARAALACELTDAVLADPRSELGVLELTLLDVRKDGQHEIGVAFVPFSLVLEDGDLTGAPVEVNGAQSTQFAPIGELATTFIARECMRSVRAGEL